MDTNLFRLTGFCQFVNERYTLVYHNINSTLKSAKLRMAIPYNELAACTATGTRYGQNRRRYNNGSRCAWTNTVRVFALEHHSKTAIMMYGMQISG